MPAALLQIGEDYWENIEIDKDDIQSLAAHLFEIEQPLELEELSKVLVRYRINKIEQSAKKNQSDTGKFYYPRDNYQVGDILSFPHLNWVKGIVEGTRPGNNPELGEFQVLSVKMQDGQIESFAAGLKEHALNAKDYESAISDVLNPDQILANHHKEINAKLGFALQNQKDLVRIGLSWFPKSLLLEINQGHLNLAEAFLDSREGGPITIEELLDQLEIKNVESKQLLEFSMNYALQEDPRFDEVGTSGVFSWFLRRLEPKSVLEVPETLQVPEIIDLPDGLSTSTLRMLEELDDEFCPPDGVLSKQEKSASVSVTLTYPHWRVGSLPLSAQSSRVFPSAIFTDHIKIAFIDSQTNETISAWVVRPGRYVIGLKEWYESQNLIPGSIIELSSTLDPGVINISAQKKRSNKEWIKTVLFGADGGLVIALLRQSIYAGFSDRMAIAVTDVNTMDQIWKDRKPKNIQLKTDTIRMVNELSKLNQQRHVHFVDLYASLNLIRRVPPQNLLHVLMNNPEFLHVGDNYYHLVDTSQTE
ncbi:MAG: hypothetical protein ACOYKD_07280 [Anaerolineaceae bacterium]|jgi:hypothetical protein